MKRKTYGSNIDPSINSGLEAVSKYDIVSDRNINRPIFNLYEDQEKIYKLLNTLLKAVYGKAKAEIIRGIDEEFDIHGFEIGKLGNNKNDYYLRIPTGSMFIRNNDSYTNDDDKSFVYNNSPDLSKLERQFANMIDLNLSDQENNVTINSFISDRVTKIYTIISGELNLDEHNNIIYLKKDSKELYYCTPENARYYIPSGSYSGAYGRYYVDSSVTPSDVSSPGSAPEESLTLTDDIKNASKNGKCINYDMDVTINTQYGKIKEHFPEKGTKTSWKIDNLKAATVEGKEVYISIDKEDGESISISFSVEKGCTDERFRYLIVNNINLNQTTLGLAAVEVENGIKIYFIKDDPANDNYKLSIQYIDGGNKPYIIEKREVAEKFKNNKYYNNIFELFNSFYGKYDNYFNAYAPDFYNFISGEVLLKIPDAKNFYVYYDLKANPENGKKVEYDKTGHFYISSEEKPDLNLIKLWTIDISRNESGKLTGINSIKTDLKLSKLDKVEIMDADLDVLNVDKKTTLTGTTTIQDDTKGTNKIEVKSGGVTSTGNTTIVNGNRSIILDGEKITLSETNDTDNKVNTIEVDKNSVNISGTDKGAKNKKSIKVDKDSIDLKNTKDNGISIKDNSTTVTGTTTIQDTTDAANKIEVKPTEGIAVAGTTTVTGTTTIKDAANATNSIEVNASGTTVTGTTTIQNASKSNKIEVDTNGTTVTGNTKITKGDVSIDANKTLSLGIAKIKADIAGNIIFYW